MFLIAVTVRKTWNRLERILRRRHWRVVLAGRLSRESRRRRCILMLVEAVSEGAKRPVADNGDRRNSSEEEHLHKR